MAMLDVALSCIERGWYVFPCKPGAKEPLVPGGFKAATNSENKIHEWWTKWPKANVGIATGASGLTVLDIDHGLTSVVDLRNYQTANGLPETYTVRTGRGDGFGVQLYYSGEGLKSIAWEDVQAFPETVRGDVRGGSGYVLAAGSLHPSGAFYEALVEAPIASVPDFVRALKPAPVSVNFGGTNEAFQDDGGPIIGSRNVKMASVLGRLRRQGYDDDRLREAAETINETRVQPCLAEWELDRIVSNICKYPVGEVAPEVVIGKPGAVAPVGPPKDWRSLFHTREQTENTPDPEFLIDGFLQVESVTGIIGPARARKSIVVVNIIRALLTGEPLFGHFNVDNQPGRVVYLCPESGLKSLAKRIRNMGLSQFVGDTLFYTSMNSEPIELMDPLLREAAKGAVVIIDTAIRFFKGNENDSQDVKVLGEHCHGLIRDGVLAVVLLHHTSKNAESVTLESGRGSGDFGGFLTCCWGTTLEDFEDAYNSKSHMSCVKQRDFQADRFNLAPSGDQDDFVLKYVPGSENAVLAPKTRFKGNRDGKDDAAVAIINAHPALSLRELVELLDTHGIKRGKDWTQKNRRAGVKVKDSPGK